MFGQKNTKRFLSLETKWTEKEIGFQVDLEEVKYVGNEGLFLHIWINLLDNAIKFSPAKGTITMFLKQEQDSVRFILEDEGPGIEDDVKSRTGSNHRKEPGSSFAKSAFDQECKRGNYSFYFCI